MPDKCAVVGCVAPGVHRVFEVGKEPEFTVLCGVHWQQYHMEWAKVKTPVRVWVEANKETK